MPRLLLIYLFVLIKVQGYVPYLPTHDANSSLINVSINLNFNGLNNCNFLPLKSSSYFFLLKVIDRINPSDFLIVEKEGDVYHCTILDSEGKTIQILLKFFTESFFFVKKKE